MLLIRWAAAVCYLGL